MEYRELRAEEVAVSTNPFNIEKLISIAEQSEADAKGGNKKCFLIGDYALLQGTINEEETKRLMEMGNDLKSKGVNIARTLDYKITNGQKGYSLQEKAVGTPLHNMVHWSVKKGSEEFNIEQKSYSDRLSSLTQENQEFYDKFVQDWVELQKSGISVDPSKPANFYYEKGKGITFIDLDHLSEDAKKYPMETMCYEMASVLIGSGKYYRLANNEDFKQELNSNISKIFGRFAKAMESVGMSFDDVKSMLNDKFEGISIEEPAEIANISPANIIDSINKKDISIQEINIAVNEIKNLQTKDLEQDEVK